MAISDRYMPPHPPGANGIFGYDFSAILPPGAAIEAGSLSIVVNTNPVATQTDWTQGPVTIVDRRLFCQLSGGVEGTDYQLRWVATDADGNVWPRTAYALCAQAS